MLGSLRVRALVGRSISYKNTSTMADKKYIVIFKENATEEQINEVADEVHESGGKVNHRYQSIMKGFSATLSDNFITTLQGNLASNGIEYIEEDSVVTTNMS